MLKDVGMEVPKIVWYIQICIYLSLPQQFYFSSVYLSQMLQACSGQGVLMEVQGEMSNI